MLGAGSSRRLVRGGGRLVACALPPRLGEGGQQVASRLVVVYAVLGAVDLGAAAGVADDGAELRLGVLDGVDGVDVLSFENV